MAADELADVRAELAASMLHLIDSEETVAERAMLIEALRPRIVLLLERGAATLDAATVQRLRDLVQDGGDWK